MWQWELDIKNIVIKVSMDTKYFQQITFLQPIISPLCITSIYKCTVNVSLEDSCIVKKGNITQNASRAKTGIIKMNYSYQHWWYFSGAVYIQFNVCLI